MCLQTSEEVDKLYWKQQQAEWEQRKQDLLSAFTHSGTDLLNITVQQQVCTVMMYNIYWYMLHFGCIVLTFWLLKAPLNRIFILADPRATKVDWAH